MREQMLLARTSLRRGKGQTVILTLLVLISAFVMSLWLMLATDYHENFDHYHADLNAEDVLLTVTMPEDVVRPEAQRIADSTPGVTDSEITGGYSVWCTFAFNEGEATGEMFVLRDDDAFRKRIGRPEIVKEDPSVEEGIYFPMIFETGDIRLGAEVEITAGSTKLTVPVRGFINSIMAGSMNCTTIELLATEKQYEELARYGVPATLFSLTVDDKEQSKEIGAEVTNRLGDAFPEAGVTGSSYSHVRRSRYVSQMITGAVLGVAACIVLLVAMIIASSNTVNHIQETMPDLGVLKGLGYTGSMLVGAEVLQYTLISLPASIAGAALACAAFPGLSETMDAQTGIPYSVHFLPGPFAASVFVCWAGITVSAWFAARRIRRIEPIVALRSGVVTHSFSGSRMPLSRSRGSAVAALSVQDCFAAGRRNALICATMIVLTLLVVFAAVMARNVLMDPQQLLEMIGVECGDAMLVVDAGKEDELQAWLEDDERVERGYLYHTEQNVPDVGGTEVAIIVIDDARDLVNQSTLAEGRYPKYDNETVVGALHAEGRGLSVGDTIRLGSEEHSADFLITGLSQGSNYLGDEAYLTREGYERIGGLDAVSYYVLLRDGDADEFLDDAAAHFGPSLRSAVNVRSILDGTMASYVAAVQLIVWVLIALTILLVILVLVLVSRTTMAAQTHEYGILKALGYTSGEIVRMTVLSFGVPIVLSSLVGLVLWPLAMNPLISIFLRAIGTVRSSFVLPPGMIAAGGAALICLALLTVRVMASRIRRIAPAVLLTEA